MRRWRHGSVLVAVALVSAGGGAAAGALLARPGDASPDPSTARPPGDASSLVRLAGFECWRMSPALGEADGMLCNRLQPFHPSYQVFLSSRRIDVFKVTKGHRPRVVFHAVQP